MLAGGAVSASRTSFQAFCNASAPLSGTIRARVGELLGASQPWIGGYEARHPPGPSMHNLNILSAREKKIKERRHHPPLMPWCCAFNRHN